MAEGFDTVTSQGPAEAAVHVYRLAHDTDADQRRRIRKNLQAAMAAADAAVAGDVAFTAALTDESRAWLDALRAIVPGHRSRMELMTLVMVILMVLTFLEQNEPPPPDPPVELLEQLDDLQERIEELEPVSPETSAPAPEASAAPRRVNKVGRNAPCPRGSGAKYKKCHGP